MPQPKPAHHALIPDDVYDHEHKTWVNADKVTQSGVDLAFDAFTYPWPMADNEYDGALLSHLVEHIPHPINVTRNSGNGLIHCGAYWQTNIPRWRNRCEELADMQGGWFAFFSELHRVIRPGGVAHVLCPYGLSVGAISDPTHTRLVTELSFSYFIPNPDAPFEYNVGSEWAVQEFRVSMSNDLPLLLAADGDGVRVISPEQARMYLINSYVDLYVRLEVVK